MQDRPLGHMPSRNSAPCKVYQGLRPYRQIKRIPSVRREPSLRQNREDLEGLDVPVY